MEEQVSAVERFADDLRALGLAQQHLVTAIGLYVEALFKPSRETWGHFYGHVSQTLQQVRGEPLERDAALRMFALIDDDFARNVLEPPVRARLRKMFDFG